MRAIQSIAASAAMLSPTLDERMVLGDIMLSELCSLMVVAGGSRRQDRRWLRNRTCLCMVTQCAPIQEAMLSLR